jgi:hypothetical protein
VTAAVAGPVLGIDGGHRDRAELEHALLHALDDAGCPPPLLVCTHPVHTGQAHHAASVEFVAGTPADGLTGLRRELAVWAAVAGPDDGSTDGPDEYRPGAAAARAALLAREGGRAVRFPGWELLRGRLTVAEVLATGGVEGIEPLGTEVSSETVVDTRDFVRPVIRGGALVLEVTPAAGGTVIPLELEHQHVCGH